MNADAARLLHTLQRVVLVMHHPLLRLELLDLMGQVPRTSACPVLRPPRARVIAVPPMGRQLPPPPKARPLHNRLQGISKPRGVELQAPDHPKDPPPDPLGHRMREAEGARALLLEVVRRAAYDWVLYRSSRRIDQRQLAEDAYTWLFSEEEGHPNWALRHAEHKDITAFLTICQELDLDAYRVRNYIKNLTPNKVMSSGRPPENGRATDHSPAVEIHASIPYPDGCADSFDFDSLIHPQHEYD